MRIVYGFVSVAILLGLSLGAGPGKAGKRANPSGDSDPKAQLQSLSWMTGTWVRNEGGDYLEESWSSPEGDCMIGVFRWIKGGKLWMMELMTISIDDGQLAFRLRHFDKKQTPWEPKDAPFYYPLLKVGKEEVVFENPERDSPRQFVFRHPDEDSYVVALVPPKGKKGHAQEFRFERKE